MVSPQIIEGFLLAPAEPAKCYTNEANIGHKLTSVVPDAKGAAFGLHGRQFNRSGDFANLSIFQACDVRFHLLGVGTGL